MALSSSIVSDQGKLGLFERLPDTLFRPLAAQNRHLYWDLLLHLYEEFFGPDAPPPPEDGWLFRTVTAEIERFVSIREWIQAEDDEAAEGVGSQASVVLRTLLESGWIQEERIGVRSFLAMHPTVQKFLELLKQFAEEGPQIIGGKVQMIVHQLRAVQANPGEQGDGFHEAAKAARALISALNATNVRVREAMEMMSAHEATADFIRAFFSDYVAKLYIRDYHELRTDNHPLRHRFEILQIVLDLRDDDLARDALIRRYRSAFRAESKEQAEALFEKDVSHFLLLSSIDEHLDRLDASVSRTTRRALSYIHYRLRTQDRLDQLLEHSFAAFAEADAEGVLLEWSFGQGPLLAEERLREARVPPPPTVRSPVRRPRMTPEMRALNELRKLAQRNREVTPAELVRYVEMHVVPGADCGSECLPIGSIKEFCLFSALKRLANAAHITPVSRQRHVPQLAALKQRGISLALVPGETVENEYLITQKFRVQRSQHAT